MNYAETVRGFVVNNFLLGEAGGLQDDTSFLESGIIDSTGVLELVAFLEGTFRLKVASEELVPENLDSVNRVSQFIIRKLAEGGHLEAGPVQR